MARTGPPSSAAPADPPEDVPARPVQAPGAPSLVLASGSPRRGDLLARAGVAFHVMPSDVGEEPLPGEGPQAMVERLALAKARAVARRLQETPRRVVLGADTVVVRDGEMLGKPRDAAEARAMLRSLMGRSHVVWTGVAVVETAGGRERVRSVASRVVMREASDEELAGYVAGGEPLDKAGAYGLQGEGRRFVRRVEGSESNVIGLPLAETLALLREAGVAPAPG